MVSKRDGEEQLKAASRSYLRGYMPLEKSKSKSAFKHNLKAEMNAGKPQKQAVAIAYSVQRKAKGRGK